MKCLAIDLCLIILSQLLIHGQKENTVIPNESEESKELTVIATPTPLPTISPLPPIENKWRIWPPDLRYAIFIPSSTPLLNIYRFNPLHYIVDNGNPFGRNIKVIFRGCCANVTDINSDGIRYIIFNTLKGLPGWDIEESSDRDEYSRLLARSKYGLTPSEWSLDVNRIWEYIAFGVVPIVIADGIIKPFEDDIDWDSMIVRIRRNDVHRIDEILDAISEDEYQRKRERVWLIGKYLVINNGCVWHFVARSFCRMLKRIDQEIIYIDGYTFHST
ncbi:glycosyltransferase family 47 protein [Gigaspora margarita]|uniref:Glycosyltransferase family 47 protein n=1 Tax=Gigaspora margarita TaxID=4874 RepID=A0A8H3X9K1_GIGMA|nr:glycosyltransferase family 47 protein [Gigaspora margarita]